MRIVFFVFLFLVKSLVYSQGFENDMKLVSDNMRQISKLHMDFQVRFFSDSTLINPKLMIKGILLKNEETIFKSTDQITILDLKKKRLIINKINKSIDIIDKNSEDDKISPFDLDSTYVDSNVVLASNDKLKKGYRVFPTNGEYRFYDVWINIETKMIERINFYFFETDENKYANGYMLEVSYSYNYTLSNDEIENLRLENYIVRKNDTYIPVLAWKDYKIN